MAKKDIYKCNKCKKEFDNNDVAFVKINNRRYCPTCAEIRQSEIEIEKQSKERHKEYLKKQQLTQKQSSEDYKSLIATLCEITGLQVPNPMWFATIKRMVKGNEQAEYDFTYKGIEITLQYVFYILEKPIKNAGAILEIVPYYYEDAKEFYKERLILGNKANAFFEDNELFSEVNITRELDSSEGLNGHNKLRDKVYDLEDIMKDGEDIE